MPVRVRRGQKRVEIETQEVVVGSNEPRFLEREVDPRILHNAPRKLD